MPFKSKSQQKWMFANKPQMAKEWASKTPNINALPEHKTMNKKKAITKYKKMSNKMGIKSSKPGDLMSAYNSNPAKMMMKMKVKKRAKKSEEKTESKAEKLAEKKNPALELKEKKKKIKKGVSYKQKKK